ncbi:MAG: glycosyltransferase family 2 protein [Candidatus Moranbacteria bacterium]|nr:glycosyltransferase family 2 protein [Candidatus Moranbacteria bacterium]
MNANPSVSLIFVNYRSARYLTGALKSLFSFELADDFFEVIVVNNDSSERIALQNLQRAFPFLLIESSENTGFGCGCNLGARRARGAILGFINPDVLWEGTYLRKIAAVFGENRQVGVLGMALFDTKRRPEAWSVGEEPSFISLSLNNFLPVRRAAYQNQKSFSSDWVSGGALFVRAALFAEIGGFDERFFLYFEDADLCKVVRRLGFSVISCPQFPLIHLGGKSQISRQLQKKHFYDSQKKYFEKHRPTWENNALKFLHFFFRKIQV